MRAGWLAVVSLAVALVAQLSVLNGLHLPGGGVPDLVLVLVASLAMAEGPVAGMIIGFATGLCLDLAPPGGAVVGQYALVFCLAGWAAGRLSPVAGHSGRQSAGLLATALLAVVVAAAEVLTAAISLLVAPGAVTLSQIRAVLPATVGYDLVLVPFVLSLVMLAGTLVADQSAGPQRFRGLADAVGHGAQAGASARTAKARRARLRPGSGVPGSASGLVRQSTRPRAPVHIRLAGGRRGDGAIGSALGAGGAWLSHSQRGRHPGLLAGSARRFRPNPGEPGGSAVRSHSRTPRRPDRPRVIRFAGRRGDGSLGRTLGHGPTGPGVAASRRQPAIRFGGHRGDGSLGQTFGHALTQPRSPLRKRLPAIRFGLRGAASAGPLLRTGASRSTIAGPGAGPVPSVRFAGQPAPLARPSAAVPRFRRKSTVLRPARRSSGALPGGVLTEATFRARQHPPPRLRLSGGAPGMLGGTGRTPRLGRPQGRSGKQPRFSYGKRSPLSVLTTHRLGRRLGGRWLAHWRVGSRSGVWLLGRRSGASR
jgi:rod shape-determining protein MreD